MKTENLVCKIEEYLNKKYLLVKRNNKRAFVEKNNKKDKRSEINDK